MNKNELVKIKLMEQKKLIEKQLANLVFGSIEIRRVKEKDYIYLHKRDGSIVRTQYIGDYTEELNNQIIKNNLVARELKKKLRQIIKELKGFDIDYTIALSDKVKLNVDLAKRNLVDTIYKQAVLEGVAVTYLDTETIIEGGKINNISADDVQKINNLKHAWQFVLDENVLQSSSNYGILCQINKLIEEGFYYNAGNLRIVPVSIAGTKWKPELPIVSMVQEELGDILDNPDIYDRAINALLYTTRKQLFIDGNKRTSVVFANHILISNGCGMIVIPENMVNEYKLLLIQYYESNNNEEIKKFLYEKCLIKI